jgi:hypothetical protein
VKTYRDSLDTVTADLKKAQQKFQRSALGLGSSGAGRPLDFDKSLDARTRMQQNTDKLRGGTDLLNSAHVQLEETLGVGTLRLPPSFTSGGGGDIHWQGCPLFHLDGEHAQHSLCWHPPPAGSMYTHWHTHTHKRTTAFAAASTAEELNRNRETINRVRGNVGIVSSTMDEARRILRSAARTLVQPSTQLASLPMSLCRRPTCRHDEARDANAGVPRLICFGDRWHHHRPHRLDHTEEAARPAPVALPPPRPLLRPGCLRRPVVKDQRALLHRSHRRQHVAFSPCLISRLEPQLFVQLNALPFCLRAHQLYAIDR